MSVADPKTVHGARFSTSADQGGAWSLQTAPGRIDGFTWGNPLRDRHAVIGTIDAGTVGCPALSP
jgi:hypothetical protein